MARTIKDKLKWSKLNLSYKLLILYIPFIIIPALAGMIFISRNHSQVSQGLVAEYTNDFLKLYIQKLDEITINYEKLSRQFITDPNLETLLKSKSETMFGKFETDKSIDDRIAYILQGYEYVKSVVLTTGSNRYVYGGNDINSYHVYDDSYQQEIRDHKGSPVWFLPRTFNDGEEVFDAFRLSRVLRDSKLSETALLTMVIDIQSISSVFERSRFGNNMNVIVSDNKGILILEQNGINNVNKRDFISFTVVSPHTGWRLTAQYSLKDIYKAVYRTTNLSYFAISIFIILGIIGIYFIAREAITNQKRKQQADMRVLQKQLSPHFLYNSLNSIRWMAMIQKQNNIKVFTDSLIILLNYSIRNTGVPVSLENEIKVLEDYVNIQKIRYHDFSVSINIPDELKNAEILKFLIQPIIENSIVHGFSRLDKRGEISITGRLNHPNVELTIQDNGTGMDKKRLDEIREGLYSNQRHDRIGLCSINERMQLHYGKKFSIVVESTTNIGTCVRIIFPFKKFVKKVKDNEDNYYS